MVTPILVDRPNAQPCLRYRAIINILEVVDVREGMASSSTSGGRPGGTGNAPGGSGFRHTPGGGIFGHAHPPGADPHGPPEGGLGRPRPKARPAWCHAMFGSAVATQPTVLGLAFFPAWGLQGIHPPTPIPRCYMGQSPSATTLSASSPPFLYRAVALTSLSKVVVAPPPAIARRPCLEPLPRESDWEDDLYPSVPPAMNVQVT
ncbi:hypothetical protein SEVIR_4G106801v4 [Setaria viridis]|uniref:Uncharacterized protein n=1 Tax=Setaria viridis TaxID=4556 RepID=A0A4U6UYL5_SETVI|nr:hypothetical protein SEVIR_4G106801v2 [Setaria viridis]